MLPHLAFYEVPGNQTQVVRLVHGLPTESSPSSLIRISLVTNTDHLSVHLVTGTPSLEEYLFAPFASCYLGSFREFSYPGVLRIK